MDKAKHRLLNSRPLLFALLLVSVFGNVISYGLLGVDAIQHNEISAIQEILPPPEQEEANSNEMISCRIAANGVERWNELVTINQTSSWRRGGGSPQRYCEQLISSKKENFPENVTFEIIKASERQRDARPPFRVIEYKYSCSIVVSKPVYAEAKSPECPPTDSDEAAYVMAAYEFVATDLIGSNIMGADHKSIASIEDVLIGTETNPSQIIFDNGKNLGIAGDLGTLPFSSVALIFDDEGRPEVWAGPADEIEGVAKFEYDRIPDFRLASELIGENAELSVAEVYAHITDLIMTTDGAVRHAVVTNYASTTPLVIDFNAILVVQGDSEGDLMIDVTPDQLALAPVLQRSKLLSNPNP